MTGAAGMSDTASLVQPCDDLDATIDFFRIRLGFRLEMIFPADDPTVAVISGHGLRLRLERGVNAAPATLRLPRAALPDEAENEIIAPNGTRILLATHEIPDLTDPVCPDLVIERDNAAGGAWNVGRAGMHYRDLLPGRWNGHVVASHIRIPVGGPVPDYVHHHDVRFQMIYCHRGWVRVVYEDQGEPFVMQPDDCVLQPPGIRHRVLEASDGLEVIEIGCPALHATHAEHALTLPSPRVATDRTWAGQRFVRHVAVEADWESGSCPGHDTKDLGIAAATDGLAGVAVHRLSAARVSVEIPRTDGFRFLFVVRGAVSLTLSDTTSRELRAGDSAALPPGPGPKLGSRADGTEVLEVTLSPAVFSP